MTKDLTAACDALVNNPALQIAMQGYNENVFQAWLAAETADEREAIYKEMAALGGFIYFIQANCSYVNNEETNE